MTDPKELSVCVTDIGDLDLFLRTKTVKRFTRPGFEFTSNLVFHEFGLVPYNLSPHKLVYPWVMSLCVCIPHYSLVGWRRHMVCNIRGNHVYTLSKIVRNCGAIMHFAEPGERTSKPTGVRRGYCKSFRYFLDWQHFPGISIESYSNVVMKEAAHHCSSVLVCVCVCVVLHHRPLC
jgi:hypothetical protein